MLEAIAAQDKLTEELKAQIENCLLKTELEDLYLPYRPKRRTRATAAKEKAWNLWRIGSPKPINWARG